MTALDSAAELGFALAAELERHGVPYALGGALAYGIHAVPRGTNDVDVNIFLKPDALAPAFASFRALEVAVDEAAATRDATKEGAFILRHQGMRIDVFTPSIDFAWEALRTRVARSVEGKQVWFLSAEALAVFKMLLFRGKDVVDLERLVATAGSTMDLDYVRGHLVQMMGAEDPRVARWDQLVRDHRPT